MKNYMKKVVVGLITTCCIFAISFVNPVNIKAEEPVSIFETEGETVSNESEDTSVEELHEETEKEENKEEINIEESIAVISEDNETNTDSNEQAIIDAKNNVENAKKVGENAKDNLNQNRTDLEKANNSLKETIIDYTILIAVILKRL